MSHPTEKQPRSQRVLLLLFIPMLLIVAWRLTPLPAYLFRLFNPPEKIAEVILNDPIAASSIGQFKSSFPSEFEKMVEFVGMETKIGSDDKKLQGNALKFLRTWLSENPALIAKASTPALGQLADANLAYVNALQKQDLSACAKFADKGYLPQEEFSEDLRIIANGYTKAMILTAKSGSESGTKPRTVPTQEVRDKFKAGLKKAGLTARQFAVLDKGVGAVDRPISPVDICKAGQTAYSVLAQMPEEEKADMMAYLFPRTFRPEPVE